MGNRAYFRLLAALLLPVLAVGWGQGFGWEQWLWVGAGLVFYLWCKDVFAGRGWWPGPAPAAAPAAARYEYEEAEDAESARRYRLSAAELAALPALPAAERAAYEALARLCVAPEDQAETRAFLAELRDLSASPRCPSTLAYVCDISDAAGWYFLTALDGNTPAETLLFVLRTALWPQRLAVAWPDGTAYAPRATVATPGVWAGFDQALRAVGWQVGLLDAGTTAEYVFVLHLVADAPPVRAAVRGIGYRYSEV